MRKKKRKILICGAKAWKNKALVESVLQIIVDDPNQTTVIHEGCKGAAKMAGYAAKQLGCSIIRVLAEWVCYGYKPGPTYTDIMLKHAPDLVIGFHVDIEKSEDTKHTIEDARKVGIPTYIISSSSDLKVLPTVLSRDFD